MTTSLHEWIDYVFDHQVTSNPWWFALDADDVDVDATTEATLYAETFERSAELLHRFSLAQLNQALTYLTSNSCSEHMFALLNTNVDQALRLRAVRSFVPLFENTMLPLCANELSHLDEASGNPLNTACYMWWDSLPYPCIERWRKDTAFKEAALNVMQQQLAMPHDAVRESALHGLGHWHHYYPKDTRRIVKQFLNTTSNLRDDLIDYAEAAAEGMVQ